MEGRHRGTAAKTLGEMVEVYLDWREHNGKPIEPRTIQGYRALYEARIKPGVGKLRLPQVDSSGARSVLHSAAKEREPPQARRGAVGESAPRRTRRHLGRARAGGAVRLGSLQPCGACEASSATERQAGDADQGSGARALPLMRPLRRTGQER